MEVDAIKYEHKSKQIQRCEKADCKQITSEVLQQTIAGINHDLTNNVRICGGIISGCIVGGSLDVSEIKNPTLIDFPLNNLKLQVQDFHSKQCSCHSRKFCRLQWQPGILYICQQVL